MQNFADSLHINPESKAKLIDLLNTIASVSDVDNDIHEALYEVKHRFATLFACNIQVDKGEANTVSSLEEPWKEVVQRSKAKDLPLFDAKVHLCDEGRSCIS
jgi:hypothetical protein